MKQFVTFNLDKQLFAIEIMYIRELNQNLEITPVQRAPEYVKGMINLRGQIVTIFDIGVRLGLDHKDTREYQHNIILKTNSELASARIRGIGASFITSDDPAGLLIDTFGDVIEIEDDEVEPPPANINDQERHFISGVVKNENELFAVLDVGKLLSA